VQVLAAFQVETVDERHHGFADGLMKIEAVLRSVVEPAQGGKHVVTKVGKARVQGHLVAEAYEFGKELVEGLGILAAACLNGAIGRFAHGAVGVFEAVGGLRQGQVLAVEGHVHGPHGGRVLLLLGADFGFERDVFEPVNLQRPAHRAQKYPVAALIESAQVGRGQHFLVQGVVVRRRLGLHFVHEVLKGLGPTRILGIAGHVDVAPRQVFAQHSFQF